MRYKYLIPDFERFVAYLANNAALMLAGRYHAVSFALNMGIPFVAVPSNSFKVEALLEYFGMENRLLSREIGDQSGEVLMEEFGVFSQSEIRRIDDIRVAERMKAHKMFDAIADIVGSTG